MQRIGLILLAGLCMLACANAGCENEMVVIAQEAQKLKEGNNAPPCFAELGLDKFQVNPGDDEEKKSAVFKAFLGWLSEQNDDIKQKIKDCFEERLRMLRNAVSGKVPEECVNEFLEKLKKKRGQA